MHSALLLHLQKVQGSIPCMRSNALRNDICFIEPIPEAVKPKERPLEPKEVTQPFKEQVIEISYLRQSLAEDS